MRPLALALLCTAAFAQQPTIENARVEKRNSSGPLAQQLAQFGAGPFWAGYSEPIVAGRHGTMCGSHELEGSPMRLEGQTAIVILIRMEGGQTDQLRLASPDCRIDAGGLPFIWIENVPPAESIAWLKTNLNAKPDTVINAVALHAGPAADQALDELSAASNLPRVREKTAFWFGNARGAHGLQALKRMFAADASPRVREQVIFGFTQSKEPGAMSNVIEAARNDKDPAIRSKALFWLSQKASDQQTRDAIRNALTSDPELKVKEQAVFALHNLPNNEGLPALIDVAKTHHDPAVRKKAIFWLGQSKDPRAVDFFAQILKQ